MAEDTIRALLIEDSPTDAFLLTQLVSESPARVKLLYAERLSQGLDVLRRGSIDVVLLDLGLPDANGIEAVVRTREAVPGVAVAVVILTGIDDEATALQAMQAGAQDYLVKGHVDGLLLVRASGTPASVNGPRRPRSTTSRPLAPAPKPPLAERASSPRPAAPSRPRWITTPPCSACSSWPSRRSRMPAWCR